MKAVNGWAKLLPRDVSEAEETADEKSVMRPGIACGIINIICS